MRLELTSVWRCVGCGKEIATSGTQTASDMEAFVFENMAPKHACRPGSLYSTCEMVTFLETDDLVPAAPPKRGPGRPPKVRTEV